VATLEPDGERRLDFPPRPPSPRPKGSFQVAQKARCVSCDDCYFRKTSLCALELAEPCPTFRPAVKGQMVPPRQPQLVEAQTQFVPAWLSASNRVATNVA
jgi:hypothetical protein